METYGQMIARLRDARGWSQEELARAADVPKRTIQDIELDKVKTPQRRTRQKLEMALEIEGDPDETRQAWSKQVKLYVDVFGALMTALTEQQQHDLMTKVASAAMEIRGEERRPNGQR